MAPDQDAYVLILTEEKFQAMEATQPRLALALARVCMVCELSIARAACYVGNASACHAVCATGRIISPAHAPARYPIGHCTRTVSQTCTCNLQTTLHMHDTGISWDEDHTRGQPHLGVEVPARVDKDHVVCFMSWEAHARELEIPLQ